jgi:Flp pilus assembly protein TadG
MEQDMFSKKSERGQAIILIVFALIGLVGMTGLTVDGGMAYGDRRRAQNAADSAAFAAALANSKNEDIEDAAKSIAGVNGYNNDGLQNEVMVTSVESPSGTCPYDFAGNRDITVEIISHAETYFAPIVGIKSITNRVTEMRLSA